MISHQLAAVQAVDASLRSVGNQVLQSALSKHLPIVQALLSAAVDNQVVLNAGLAHILTEPRIYTPITLGRIAAALRAQIKNPVKNSPTAMLVEEAKQRLVEITSSSRKEGDWSVVEHVPCQCGDCARLKTFLLSATAQTLIWPLAKPRRQHIHNIIELMMIPVTHVTERQGSPQKLVLKKLSDLFKIDQRQRKAAALELKNISGNGGGT
jgi:hypothetical protein